jgi:hypothetical protein
MVTIGPYKVERVGNRWHVWERKTNQIVATRPTRWKAIMQAKRMDCEKRRAAKAAALKS